MYLRFNEESEKEIPYRSIIERVKKEEMFNIWVVSAQMDGDLGYEKRDGNRFLKPTLVRVYENQFRGYGNRSEVFLQKISPKTGKPLQAGINLFSKGIQCRFFESYSDAEKHYLMQLHGIRENIIKKADAFVEKFTI